MEKSNTFVRGQVWYWVDPIFGRKENDMDVAVGESVMRYSRYVIITQDTSSVSKVSILVVPCSSTNNTPHDVQVPIQNHKNEGSCYARVRSIFPANPKYLDRYICTLPDSIMDKIEAELIKLVVPTVYSSIKYNNIEPIMGIDLNSKNICDDKHDLSIVSFMREFIQNRITVTEYSDDTISYRTLRKEYNYFARQAGYNKPVDDQLFIQVFKEIINDYGEVGVNDNNSFNYISIKSNVDDDVIESDLCVRLNSNSHHIISSIKKFASMMRLFIHENELYDVVKCYLNKKPKMLPSDFYTTIYQSIVDSMLKVLKVSVNNGKAHIPVIREEDKHFDTWHFMIELYINNDISRDKSIPSCITKFVSDNGNVNMNEFYDILSNELSRSTLSKYVTDVIISMMRSVFTECK